MWLIVQLQSKKYEKLRVWPLDPQKSSFSECYVLTTSEKMAVGRVSEKRNLATEGIVEAYTA